MKNSIHFPSSCQFHQNVELKKKFIQFFFSLYHEQLILTKHFFFCFQLLSFHVWSFRGYSNCQPGEFRSIDWWVAKLLKRIYNIVWQIPFRFFFMCFLYSNIHFYFINCSAANKSNGHLPSFILCHWAATSEKKRKRNRGGGVRERKTAWS